MDKTTQHHQQAIDKTYQQGQIIFKQHELSKEVYIIQKGIVSISKQCADNITVMAQLKRGDFFGEMSLLENEPRYATARAETDVQVLVLNSGGFMQLLRLDPSFAFEMMQKLSMRIRLLNDNLLKVMQNNSDSQRLIAQIYTAQSN